MPGKLAKALAASSPEMIGLLASSIASLNDGTLKSLVLGAGPVAVTYATAVLVSLRKKETLDFLKLIDKKAKEIGETILENEDVQQALFNTLEAISATIDQEKCSLIKKIFIDGVMNDEERGVINFEKMINTSQLISAEGIEFLRFIKVVIIPRKKAKAIRENDSMNKSTRDYDDKWWTEHHFRSISESSVISEWVTEEFSPNSIKIQKKVPGIEKDVDLARPYHEKERRERDKTIEREAELVSLGIMRGTISDLYLSDFGKEFIKFIEN